VVSLDLVGLVLIPGIAIVVAVLIAYLGFKRESILKILMGMKNEEIEELKMELRREIEKKKEGPREIIPREIIQPGPTQVRADPWRDLLKIIHLGKALVELGKMLPEDDDEEED